MAPPCSSNSNSATAFGRQRGSARNCRQSGFRISQIKSQEAGFRGNDEARRGRITRHAIGAAPENQAGHRIRYAVLTVRNTPQRPSPSAGFEFIKIQSGKRFICRHIKGQAMTSQRRNQSGQCESRADPMLPFRPKRRRYHSAIKRENRARIESGHSTGVILGIALR